MCLHFHACEGEGAHVCAHTKSEEQALVSFLAMVLFLAMADTPFEIGSLMAWSSLTKLGLLASEPQGSFFLCLHSVGYK